MFALTHICLPVAAAVVMNVFARRQGYGDPFTPWTYALVGLFGILPDLLHPHLYLHERLDSWSHGIPAVVAVTLLGGVIMATQRHRVASVYALMCVLAYGAHVGGDMISGGIRPWYPWSPVVWGTNWVPPGQWITLDILTTLFTAALFYVARRPR